MAMTAYDLKKLKEMVAEERASVKENGNYRWVRVQKWWVMVGTKGASLSITFEVPNTAGGTNPTITTRFVAL